MLELLVWFWAFLDSTLNLLWMFSVCDSDSQDQTLSQSACLLVSVSLMWFPFRSLPKCLGCTLVTWNSAQMLCAFCNAQIYVCQLHFQKVFYLPGCFKIALKGFCQGLHFGIASWGIHLRRLYSHFTWVRWQNLLWWPSTMAATGAFHNIPLAWRVVKSLMQRHLLHHHSCCMSWQLVSLPESAYPLLL